MEVVNHEGRHNGVRKAEALGQNARDRHNPDDAEQVPVLEAAGLILGIETHAAPGQQTQTDHQHERAEVGQNLDREGQRHGRFNLDQGNDLAAPVAKGHHGRHKGQNDEGVDQHHVTGATAGGFHRRPGAAIAFVELVMGDDFFHEDVEQVPEPGLGLAHDEHLARFKALPQATHPHGKNGHRPEEGQHENGVDGIVAVEDLPEDDAAVGGAGEPFAAVETGANPPHHQPEHGGNQEENGQAGGLAHPLTHNAGAGQILVDHVAGRAHDVGRPRAARAEIRAVAAVVAKPDVHVGHQLVFHAPRGPDHFLARIGIVFRSKRAGHGAGGALEALFERLAPGFHQLFGKAGIRLEVILCHYSLPPTCP